MEVINGEEVVFNIKDYKKRQVIWSKRNFDSHVSKRPIIKHQLNIIEKALKNLQ